MSLRPKVLNTSFPLTELEALPDAIHTNPDKTGNDRGFRTSDSEHILTLYHNATTPGKKEIKSEDKDVFLPSKMIGITNKGKITGFPSDVPAVSLFLDMVIVLTLQNVSSKQALSYYAISRLTDIVTTIPEAFKMFTGLRKNDSLSAFVKEFIAAKAHEFTPNPPCPVWNGFKNKMVSLENSSDEDINKFLTYIINEIRKNALFALLNSYRRDITLLTPRILSILTTVLRAETNQDVINVLQLVFSIYTRKLVNEHPNVVASPFQREKMSTLAFLQLPVFSDYGCKVIVAYIRKSVTKCGDEILLTLKALMNPNLTLMQREMLINGVLSFMSIDSNENLTEEAYRIVITILEHPHIPQNTKAGMLELILLDGNKNNCIHEIAYDFLQFRYKSILEWVFGVNDGVEIEKNLRILIEGDSNNSSLDEDALEAHVNPAIATKNTNNPLTAPAMIAL